jgi:hypothetical protein
MKMSLRYLITFLAVGWMASEAQAATVAIIHGINGRDLGASKQLPVDIAVNGTCSIKGIKFTKSTSVSLEEGTYRITVHPANGSCTETAVIDQTLTIDERDYSITAVASLSSKGKPQLAVYDNSIYVLRKAVAVRHAAFASPVYSRIRVTGYQSQVRRIKNGGLGDAFTGWESEIPYKITVSSRSRGGVLFNLGGRYKGTWRLFHIVGSAKNGLAVVTQDI